MTERMRGEGGERISGGLKLYTESHLLTSKRRKLYPFMTSQKQT